MNNKHRLLLTPILINAQIDRISERLIRELEAANKEISSLPEGMLSIRYRDNHVQFNNYLNGQRRGITRFPDTVYKLARRQFLELQIELLKQIIEEGWTSETEWIIAEINPEIDALLTKFEEAGLDIDRITMTPNQWIWNSDRHSRSTYRREELKYPTKKGRVYMRSKSEQRIGDMLEELRISYRYEPELTIHNRTYHPDFVIMLPNGILVILEHVGRMDLRQYDGDLITRLQAYDSIGLMLGRHVFLSFEHDTKEETLVKEVLFRIMTAAPSWNNMLQSIAARAGCKGTKPTPHD